MSFWASLTQSLEELVRGSPSPSPSPSPTPTVSRSAHSTRPQLAQNGGNNIIKETGRGSTRENGAAEKGKEKAAVPNVKLTHAQRCACALSPRLRALSPSLLVHVLTDASRVHMLEAWLEQRVLDVDAVRLVAFEYGLPDGALRARYWRVLLGTPTLFTLLRPSSLFLRPLAPQDRSVGRHLGRAACELRGLPRRTKNRSSRARDARAAACSRRRGGGD